ncbi:MAG: type II toxin-antitoxin system PemK/MazF family toxin, partial [Chloroflexota bacterium]
MLGSPPLRGQVWYTYLPGHTRDPHQPRPALVISADARNRSRDHALMIPIFSRGRLGPTHIPLPGGSGGIPHDSVLFCELITLVYYDFLADGPLGDVVPASI